MDEGIKCTEKSPQATEQKSLAEKLKNEKSSREAVRKKLRYGKKDNRLTLEEEKKIKKLRQQGRKKARAEAVASAKAHERLSESNQDQNTGVEAANRSTEVVGSNARKVINSYYSRKLHESRGNKKKAKRETEQKNTSGVGSNVTSKELQKKQLKREMAKSAEKKGLDKAGDFLEKVGQYIIKVAKENPGVLLATLVIGLILLILVASLSSCSMVAGGVEDASIASSYTAEDEEILAVDADYSALEEGLQEELDSIETDYPGYDEYNYSLDEIGHNPYELAAILTVLYEDYTQSEVQSMLQTIFAAQYELSISETVETRTRTEQRTGTRRVWDPIAGAYVDEEYTYEVEVEYDYYILNVTLTNATMDAVVRGLGLSEDQMSRYELLIETYGNKRYLFENDIYSLEVPGDYQTYDIPAEYLTDQEFANMIKCAERYLGYTYVWGGSSPETGFDCSGFVSYVINHSNNDWNVGRQTANGLLGCCSRVSARNARPGDLIFFKGTYNINGASHVGIYVGNGMMLHCGNPIQYTSIDTVYWQEHFYTFGRIN